VCNQRIYDTYVAPEEVRRLEKFSTFEWLLYEDDNNFDKESRTSKFLESISSVDGLIISHGSPTINSEIMDATSNLKIIGELEDDRFANRVDLEAAWKRNICTVDTTNGSSYPVSEWALALILISLRNAGAQFRRIIAGHTKMDPDAFKYAGGLLVRKRVGLIGCGHMGRRLMKYLQPFETEIWVYDPYLPREMAESLGFLQTSLENILSKCQVIVCLAPLTPKTRGMIGENELNRIPSGAVLVNVSRGAIINSEALIERLKRGDIIAGLDVFDPEPIPPDSEILHLPNVFITPHFAYFTGNQYRESFGLMVDELDRFFHGHETFFDLTSRSLANRRGIDSD
ncbi:MAG: NAD(P)-dependent oxidoreductase, partial [Candidatus Poribacteria bacterium]|nr:NAD(P)-dependent oxidoreductase [Candidatus Poribacteria bacterium]